MKKFFLRMTVTLLILATLGGIGWFVYVSVKKNDAFDEIVKVKSSINQADTELKSLKDIVNQITSKTDVQGKTYLEDKYFNQMHKFNKFVFGGLPDYTVAGIYDSLSNDTNIYNDSKDTNYFCLKQVYELNKNVFNYYYSYSVMAKKVSSNDYDMVNKLSKKCLESVNLLKKDVADIFIVNNQINNNNKNEMQPQLIRDYDNIVNDLVNLILNLNNLNFELKNYVVKYVFDNNMVYDKNTIANDFIMYQTKQFNNQIVVDKILVVFDDKNEFVVNNEFKESSSNIIVFGNLYYKENESSDLFIQNYETLINYKGNDYINKNAILGKNNIFRLSHQDKLKIGTGTGLDIIKSKYYVDGQEAIVRVLNYAYSSCFKNL